MRALNFKDRLRPAPAIGWISASGRGMPIVMFGLTMPPLIAKHVPGWQWTGDVHGPLAN